MRAATAIASIKPMASVTQLTARGGTLVLGGGFARGYVARLLGRRGATIVSPRIRCSIHRCCPRRRRGRSSPATSSCRSARCALTRISCSAARGIDHRGAHRVVDTIAGPATISYERLAIALGAVTRTSYRSRGSSSTGAASRTSPSRFSFAIMFCAARGACRRGPSSELEFVFVGAGYAGVEALAELSDLAHDGASLLSGAPWRAAALGARRRGTDDPRGHSAGSSGSDAGRAARASRRRHPDVGYAQRLRGETAVLSDGTTVRLARSSGRPA